MLHLETLINDFIPISFKDPLYEYVILTKPMEIDKLLTTVSSHHKFPG